MARAKILGCSLILWGGAYALPIHPIVMEGDVEFSTESNRLEIVSGASASIQWDDFSIASDESVRFVQPNAAAVALNRVIAHHPSEIFGRLESIGQVILINPNGILFGKNAIVDTGSLIASTFDLSENAYASAKEFRFSSSRIINEGALRARCGDLILLGESIANEGAIEGVRCRLFSPSANETGISNRGAISCSESIFLEAPFSVIDHEGILSVRSETGVGGEIRILGETNRLLGGSVIDASGWKGGGTILIGGDYKGLNPEIPNSRHSWAAPDAAIYVNAIESGDGGKAIFWGNDSAFFRGAIEARGGALFGDGGLIEISSKGYLDPMGVAVTTAPNGKTGTLLLDPTVVVISTDPDSGIMTLPPPGYVFSGMTANINIAALMGFLMASDVTIDASASGTAAVGSITLNATADVPSGGA
jgi:filamentous hemagglutinin family protein